MSTLTQLFTDIADAIRAKKGTSSTIVAENFPDEIASIPTGTTPTGTINITTNGTHDVTNYASANVNVVSQNNAYIDGTGITGTSAEARHYVRQIDGTIAIPNTVTDISNFFNTYKNLITAPMIDTSNVKIMNYMFYQCFSLENIPVYNTSKVTSMLQMFYGCSNLTNQSLSNILIMCTNSVISTSSNKKLSKLSLTEAQANICITLPEWSACQAAGWSTGY